MRFYSTLAICGVALATASCSSKADDDAVGGGLGGAGANAGGANGTGNSGNPNNLAGGSSGQSTAPGTGTSASAGGSATAGGNANAGAGTLASAGNSTGGDCTVKSVRATLTPPAIEFQVDITNSMTESTKTTGGMTKWEATQAALNDVLPRLPQDWLVGITFFNKPANTCYSGTQAVDIAPLSGNVQAILSAINGIKLDPRVSAWTPTMNAWMFAFGYLIDSWPTRAQYPNSKKYIVLMTDGVPTVNRDGCTTGNSCNSACVAQNEYDYFIQYIGDMGKAGGIETFFIGVPGSEAAQGAPYDPRTMLSKLAIAGGSAPAGCVPDANTGKYCHIDLTQAADMKKALADAIQYTVGDQIKPTCDFDIPKPAGADSYVNLNYTSVEYISETGAAPQSLKRATGADCTDGQYYYNDATKPTQLKLCPTLCDALGATTTGSVQITFSCTQIG